MEYGSIFLLSSFTNALIPFSSFPNTELVDWLTVIIASSRGRKLIIVRGVSIFAPFSLFAPSWVSASVP